MDKRDYVIIGLIVVIILIVQYIIIEKWLVNIQQQSEDIYQKGFESGVKETINVFFNSTKNCQPSSITLGNTTREFIDISCLKK